MKVLVLGANGQLGRAVVSRLADDGHVIRAFMRRPEGVSVLPTIEVFQGDAMQEASVREAVEGQQAVVNAIGSGTFRPNTIESDTTRVVLGALRGFQGPYIAMSAGIVAPVSFVFDNIIRPLVFQGLYREHKLVEDLVTASDLDWTIIRPTLLTNAARRGYIESTSERPHGRTTTRADVADFIAKCIKTNGYHRQAVFLVSK